MWPFTTRNNLIRASRAALSASRRKASPCKAPASLRPRLEALEERCQPSVTISEFSGGTTGNNTPYGITAGPDGNIWFADYYANQIGRITPQGAVTEFGAGISGSAYPNGITEGPDGNLWFTETNGNRIGRITPQGAVAEFSAGLSPGSGLACIIAGPDGNFWFTENNGSRIGRITPQGTVTEFSAGISPSSNPYGITAAPDGNLWFTEQSSNRIGRITPQGTVTEFSVGISVGSYPQGITAGPDGNLWFTELSGARIGRITPQGTVTEFSAGIAAGSSPEFITAGPDGNLWFTENTGAQPRIGRITPQGTVTQFSASSTAFSLPWGIAAGPDGSIWYTERQANRIGRLQSLLGTTATQLISSTSGAVAGQQVILTASVSTNPPGVGSPSGTVTFLDGTTVLGAADLAGGQAVLSTSALSAGSHSIIASCNGNPSFPASASAACLLQVSPADTTTSLSSSGPALLGAPLTLTATVGESTLAEFSANYAPFGITVGPDGNLWFTEVGSGRIGRITPQGTVTEFSAGITAGSAPEGITTGPDGNLWFTEYSGNRIGRITPKGDVTEFTSGITANSSPYRITGGPDGNLWFTQGLDQIGRITPQGFVTEFSTGISPGGEPFGITTGPDGNLWFTEIAGNRIGRITPQGTVTEFSAGITPQEITAGPDGNLWFTEGVGRIGRITSTGSVTEFSAGIFASSNPEAITTGPDGDLWFTELNGNVIGRLTPSGSVVGLKAGNGPQGITAGPDGNLWFTELNGNAIGRLQIPAGRIPTGTVSFFDGGTLLGTDPLSGGVTALTTNTLAQGSHTITAVYNPTSNFNCSASATLDQQVNLTSTCTVLTSNSSGPTVFGQAVTLTALVTDQNGLAAPGTVSFFDGNTLLDTVPLAPTGAAAFTTSTLSVATHAVVAYYNPTPTFAPSKSSPLDQQVAPASTSTTLVSSSPTNSTVFGQAVTFTATVKPVNPSTTTPTGAVSFMDGNTLLATVVLTASGSAAFTTSDLSATTHAVAAVYNATPEFNASNSGVVNQQVNPAPTGIILASSGSPSLLGDTVTFTATVTTLNPSTATPTGAVSFMDGSTPLGVVSLSGGTASFSTTTLALGDHPEVIATYVPNPGTSFLGSSAGPLDQQVNSMRTAIALSSSGSPAVFGQAVTFTATVSATNAPVTPTGTVSFFDGTMLLGTAMLSGGMATYSTAALNAGDHPNVTATYNPTANFTASTTAPLDQKVSPASTSITLASSGSPSVAGQLVIYTVTVGANNSLATPTGFVTLFAAGTPLGVGSLSGGVAVLGVTPLVAGSESITATYNPTGNFTGCTTAQALSQQLNPAAASQVVFGQQPVFSFVNFALAPTVTVRIEDAFGNLVDTSGAVTLALANNPSGAALGGTDTQPAAHGIATFAGLTVSKKGSGYTLSAASNGLLGATSNAFVISSATHLSLSAPSSVKAGSGFSLTITALDRAGKVEPNYRGTVQIISTDSAALTLVASYTFTAADQGKHTFTGLFLHTPGKVIIIASDSLKPTAITGKRLVTVAAAAALRHAAVNRLEGVNNVVVPLW
jgi:streptogramin lyase